MTTHRWTLLALWLTVFASFFLNIGSVPLFDVDEGAFSEATREMFERDDFISTYLNGAPRYDKPILIYWLQAASVSAFGVNEFAFRLPSALCATAWVWLVFAFVRRYRDETHAVRAAFMTASALAVSVIGKAATADALLNVLIVTAMFSVFAYYRERKPIFIYAAFASMALGVLAKGPVAVLIPGAVSLMFFIWRGEFKLWLRAVLHPGAWLLFIAIAVPWYIAQYLKEGQAFIDGFFFKHNLDRFSGGMEQHGGSVWYYVPVVIVGTLPFTAPMLKALTRIRASVRDDLALYALLWFGFVFVFFSLSGTKLPHYVNYGLTGLFILMSIALGQLRSALWALLPALGLCAVLLFLPELLHAFASRVQDAYWREMVDALGVSGAYRAYFLVAVLLIGYFVFERRVALQNKLLAAGAACVAGVSLFVFPVLGETVQGPVKEAARIARARGLDVVMWHISVPSVSVYRQKITPPGEPAPGVVLLTKTQRLVELPPHDVLYAKNGIALVKVKE